MKHTNFTIEIYKSHGIYPKNSVVCDEIAYLVPSGIPMLVTRKGCSGIWHDDKRRQVVLHGSLLLTRKRFPCFSFNPFPAVTLFFRDTTLQNAVSGIIDVLGGKDQLDGLHSPFNSRGSTKPIDPHYYIKKIHSINPSDYEISDHHYRSEFVAELYQRMSACNRLVHIAIYYYVNCSRLMKEHFIEDAGLNLHLVLEAIIKDVASVHGLKDKKKAFEMLQNTVTLPYCHMEYLDELYEARNEFLAHGDMEMFTEEQNINDPDRYCYEHFESVGWLIRRYIKHRAGDQATAKGCPEGM